MPRLSNRHQNVQAITLSNFEYGVDFSLPPEMLPENGLVNAVNFEYDHFSGSFKVRDALKPLVTLKSTSPEAPPLEIQTFHAGPDYYLFTVGRTLYKTNLQPPENPEADENWENWINYQVVKNDSDLDAVLEGTNLPVYCNFDNYTLIASGGKLQKYDGKTLTTIGSSFDCDIVFEQSGRVITTKIKEDYLRYSPIGDPTGIWDDKVEDPSAGKFTGVGFKDNGDITAVCPLYNDIIVFKDSNRAFRVVSNPDSDDWGIYELSRNIHNINSKTVAQVGNDIIFLDKTGLKSLATVQEYGDIKSSEEIGKRINKYLSGKIDENAQLWHIPQKRQLWIKYNNTNRIICFNTLTGASTFFEFPKAVNCVISKGYSTYVVMGNRIYVLDNTTTKEEGKFIAATWTSKSFVAPNEFLIKRIYAKFEATKECKGNILIGNVSLDMDLLSTDRYVLDMEDYCLECEEYIDVDISNPVKEERYCYRAKKFDVVFTVTEGNCILRNLRIEIAEVL